MLYPNELFAEVVGRKRGSLQKKWGISCTKKATKYARDAEENWDVEGTFHALCVTHRGWFQIHSQF
jgi:hypothetical protein